MTPITVVKAGAPHLPDAPQAWKPEIGDVLKGEEYPKQPLTKEMVLETPCLIGVGSVSENLWRGLARLNINPTELMEIFEYRCPFVKGNRYWMFIPHIILAQEVEPYAPEGFVSGDVETTVTARPYVDPYLAMALDSDWMKQCHFGIYSEDSGARDTGKITRWPIEMSGIQQAMAGHGYTNCTLPCDGHGRSEPMCLLLSNDDLLAGWLWVWFNK